VKARWSLRHTASISPPSVPGDRPPANAALPPFPEPSAWHGEACLDFTVRHGRTTFQGGASAPLKVMRAHHHADGRCELPLLHTAGGLVGGDVLSVRTRHGEGTQATLTSAAAQKVYGSIGRSRRSPGGAWARQTLQAHVERGADVEWLPQELVLYANGLVEQHTRVDLAPGASWLGAEVVRLGRTAAGEGLAAGRWRSRLEIRRWLGPDPLEEGGLETRCGNSDQGWRWEVADRLELAGAALEDPHGMGGAAVFGSLVWVGPGALAKEALSALVEDCRLSRLGLDGEMACGALESGVVARYRGPSTTAARWWFTRIWEAVRRTRQLPPPILPRVWPFQEEPLGPRDAPICSP
jgi:urease accessory protein